jgi:hypothetical protein
MRKGLIIIRAINTHIINVRDGKNIKLAIPIANPVLKTIAFPLG